MHNMIVFCIDCYQLVPAKEVLKHSAVATLTGSFVANVLKNHAETIAENWKYAEKITDFFFWGGLIFWLKYLGG